MEWQWRRRGGQRCTWYHHLWGLGVDALGPALIRYMHSPQLLWVLIRWEPYDLGSHPIAHGQWLEIWGFKKLFLPQEGTALWCPGVPQPYYCCNQAKVDFNWDSIFSQLFPLHHPAWLSPLQVAPGITLSLYHIYKESSPQTLVLEDPN